MPDQETYIIQLEDAVWLAPWRGDPGRCLCRENARVFATMVGARRSLTAARKYRPFVNATIEVAEPDDA